MITAVVPSKIENPIALGAIGGSGSRVLADIVHDAGVSIGENLNISRDNLNFTEHFRTEDVLEIAQPEFDRRLAALEQASLSDMRRAGFVHWGWKEPNTHVVIDRLLETYPKMKYIHLLRNAFDMAYSENQNQVRRWGPIFLGRSISEPPSPAESLSYFCAVHRKLAALPAGFKGRMLFVHYERLCQTPEAEITRLLDFLDLSTDVSEKIPDLVGLIKPARSIGRGLKDGLDPFRPADVDYIRSQFPEMLPV